MLRPATSPLLQFQSKPSRLVGRSETSTTYLGDGVQHAYMVTHPEAWLFRRATPLAAPNQPFLPQALSSLWFAGCCSSSEKLENRQDSSPISELRNHLGVSPPACQVTATIIVSHFHHSSASCLGF